MSSFHMASLRVDVSADGGEFPSLSDLPDAEGVTIILAEAGKKLMADLSQAGYTTPKFNVTVKVDGEY